MKTCVCIHLYELNKIMKFNLEFNATFSNGLSNMKVRTERVPKGF